MNAMPWVLSAHLIAMVCWFAGLFYLPRLFVYHADCADAPGRERFALMERRLYRGIMHPAALVTVATGLWMLLAYAWGVYKTAGWLHVKLMLVVALVVYHLWLGRWMAALAAGTNRHGPRFFRVVNELPTLALIAIVILAVVKPF
jgi:protoporphyrinogen IX oxidase